ncbi:hypothetical protein BN1002_01896 [Bacillus sp. B-jedd]|nr:hypothetical protein BN1002_01896 [Bacillus sp. B-jedd]
MELRHVDSSKTLPRFLRAKPIRRSCLSCGIEQQVETPQEQRDEEAPLMPRGKRNARSGNQPQRSSVIPIFISTYIIISSEKYFFQTLFPFAKACYIINCIKSSNTPNTPSTPSTLSTDRGSSCSILTLGAGNRFMNSLSIS